MNLVSQNFLLALLEVRKVAEQFDTIRNSVRESRLAHALQRFVGTNFVPNVGLLEIEALNSLMIPDQIHHCTHAELV